MKVNVEIKEPRRYPKLCIAPLGGIVYYMICPDKGLVLNGDDRGLFRTNLDEAQLTEFEGKITLENNGE